MIMALVRTVVSLLKICPASYSATQNILCDVDFVLMKLSKNIWLFSFLSRKKKLVFYFGLISRLNARICNKHN